MVGQRELDQVVAPDALDLLRDGRDPEVWQRVADRMDRVAAADSIAFRVGHVGRGWRVAAWLLTVVAFVTRRRRPGGR